MFLSHFLFLYCVVEGDWDSRISLPATAAVTVVPLSINRLESWILTWFKVSARWPKHRLGDEGLRDHTIKRDDALSARADVTGLRHVTWVSCIYTALCGNLCLPGASRDPAQMRSEGTYMPCGKAKRPEKESWRAAQEGFVAPRVASMSLGAGRAEE